MWKFLVDIAVNYLRKQLLPRLTVHPAFYALIDKGINMGDQIKDIYTDDNPANKQQMEDLWDENCIEVLSLGVRGVGALAKRDSVAKQKILAILANGIDDIMEDDKQTVMQVVTQSYRLPPKRANT